jgi:hypothetical protein
LGCYGEKQYGPEDNLVTLAVQVRNLREGEVDILPPDLLDTGTPYLVPEWVWVVETIGQVAPFALVVASFCHGWLVLWRILAISPLPPGIPLNWFKEALPQVFAEARQRGCVGFLTFLADNRPAEAKMARIIARLAGGTVLPFQGSMGVGLLTKAGEDGPR